MIAIYRPNLKNANWFTAIWNSKAMAFYLFPIFQGSYYRLPDLSGHSPN
jgi:hypothetical protein